MRSLKFLLNITIAFGTIVFSESAFAEVFSVEIKKRLDKDLYSAENDVIIVTKHCHHYTYGEKAVLKYENYSFDNSIIFNDGTKCSVEKLLKQ